MRVLIADDHRSFGTTLAEMVRHCGHDVVAVVCSGLEAIQSYTLHHPDLVLMDYLMPKLNGRTACRHILAKDPGARIILLSAWSPQDGAEQSGALCFLAKPVELSQLRLMLETLSHVSPAPSSAEMPAPEIRHPQDSIDYFPSIEKPPPVIESPLETSLPAATSDTSLQPNVEPRAVTNLDPVPEPAALAVIEEKSSSKRRDSHRRRAQGDRVR